MPKSKRNRVVHMTHVSKKTREHKDKLFESIRDAVPNYQHVFVFSIENARNTHIQEVRQELSDSKYVSPSPRLPVSLSLCFTRPWTRIREEQKQKMKSKNHS